MKPPVYDPTWSDEVKRIHQHDMQEMWDPTLAPQIWNQYHNQLDTYLALAVGTRPLKVLDVGCAQGTLALLLAERGHEVTAVDIRPEFLEYARSRHTEGRVEFRAGNVLEMVFDGAFNLIFANQIVEHLVYPAIMVGRLRDALAPGGRLVMSTPNGDYLKNALPSYTELGDPKEFEHRQFTADGDGHFFAYLESELAGIFREAGLEDVAVRYFETPWISGHMKLRYLHGWMPVALLRGLDRATLGLPGIGRRMAHQLLVTGCRRN